MAALAGGWGVYLARGTSFPGDAFPIDAHDIGGSLIAQLKVSAKIPVGDLRRLVASAAGFDANDTLELILQESSLEDSKALSDYGCCGSAECKQPIKLTVVRTEHTAIAYVSELNATTEAPAPTDGRGIIHFLGTDCGRGPWQNPHTSGRVRVTFSEIAGSSWSPCGPGDAHIVVGIAGPTSARAGRWRRSAGCGSTC